MGWIAAALVGLIGWLLVRDVRDGQTGVAVFSVNKNNRPIGYWAIMAAWFLSWIYCALIVIGSLIVKTECESIDPCVMTVRIPQ